MKRVSKVICAIIFCFILLSTSGFNTFAEIASTKVELNGGYWQCYDDGTIDPCHNAINSVKVISDTDAWAVGNFGNIFHWNGSEWQKFDASITQSIYDIEMLSEYNGWAVGSGGLIMHWDGFEWNIIDSPVITEFRSVDFISETDGWAVGFTGVALHWDGNSWTQISTPVSEWFGGVDMVASDNVWVVGGSTILNWDGSDWQTYPMPIGANTYLIDIDMISEDDGWAAGSNYTFLRWDGSEWISTGQLFPSNGIIFDISMNSATDGWAVGEYGAILHWNGTKWDTTTGLNSERPTLRSVDAIGNDGWIVGLGSSFLNYNGSTWVDFNVPFSKTILDVGFSSLTDGWAVAGRTILHWNGTDWSSVSNPATENLEAISVVSEDNAWAVGGKTILHWNGSSWLNFSNEPNLPYQAIYADESNVWLAGGFAVCNPTCYDVNGFVSHWDGVNWDTEYIQHRSLNSIKMVGESQGWVGGDFWSLDQPYPILLSWDGTSWTDINTSMIKLLDIATLDENNAWSIGYNTTYDYFGYRWNGSVWTEIAFPNDVYPNAIDIVNPYNVWAAGSGSITNWNGSEWKSYYNPVNNSLYTIDMVTEDKGWIVGARGTILEFISPTLTINFTEGAVGSYFNLTGADFPPFEKASIFVNDVLVGSIEVNENGSFSFTLSTEEANEGYYIVVVSVNPSASATFLLDNDLDQRAKEGDLTTYIVSENLGLQRIYLPLLNK